MTLSGSAPALAAHGQNGKPRECKTMHLLHARLKTGKSRKNGQKTGIHGAGLGLVLSRLLAA
ncbi:hypothetical protein ACLB1R_33645 [Escherichia coli]